MEQRRKIVAGNWKMHKTIPEAMEWARSFRMEPMTSGSVQVVLFPPFTALNSLVVELGSAQVELGAQDIYPGSFGAVTGEVSGAMLQDAGAQWVLIGHSERRQYFNESHGLLEAKLRGALEWGLHPVYCVGESLYERAQGVHFEVVATQMKEVMGSLEEKQAERVVIAYEPVWAIGTGKTASALEAEEMHAFIRGEMAAMWGGVSGQIPILYGGSVKPSNAAQLFRCPNIDGALVGGASLDPDEFRAVVLSV